MRDMIEDASELCDGRVWEASIACTSDPVCGLANDLAADASSHPPDEASSTRPEVSTLFLPTAALPMISSAAFSPSLAALATASAASAAVSFVAVAWASASASAASTSASAAGAEKQESGARNGRA